MTTQRLLDLLSESWAHACAVERGAHDDDNMIVDHDDIHTVKSAIQRLAFLAQELDADDYMSDELSDEERKIINDLSYALHRAAQNEVE